MSRAGVLGARLDACGVDALIVDATSNIRYLTGFSGSSGTVVVTRDAATLYTDRRYGERAAEEIELAGSGASVVVIPGSRTAGLVEALAGVGRIGVESQHVTWAEAMELRNVFGDERVVPTVGVVEALREIKDAAEIEMMTKAAGIADGALSTLLESFGPGATERQVARRLDDLVLDGGADGGAFDTIVASGPNAARPHHQAGDRVLSRGDLVIIDFGAEVGGYRSDMTRSFVLGTPSTRQQELLDGVRDAQQHGVETVRAGVSASAVDAACRSHLELVGLGQWFTHGTGHGVGLDIHEAPSVSAKGTATLAPGHVVTVEPGVYIPEYGGVRWEDTVVTTETGATPLTRSAKQPVIS